MVALYIAEYGRPCRAVCCRKIRNGSRPCASRLFRSRDRKQMRHRIAGCFIALVLLASPGRAETLQVVGAGSLTDAFSDLIRRFPTGADTIAAPEFGPSGLMRDKIESGMNVDLFASPHMDQPRPPPLAHPHR